MMVLSVVSFANCHLQKSGKETYDCFDTMSIKECTQDMDDIAFQVNTGVPKPCSHFYRILPNTADIKGYVCCVDICDPTKRIVSNLKRCEHFTELSNLKT